jgi:hypothetical protein
MSEISKDYDLLRIATQKGAMHADILCAALFKSMVIVFMSHWRPSYEKISGYTDQPIITTHPTRPSRIAGGNDFSRPTETADRARPISSDSPPWKTGATIFQPSVGGQQQYT